MGLTHGDRESVQGWGGGGDEDGNEDGGCFADTETVTLESGETKMLFEVEVGDYVQVAIAGDASMRFAPVIYIPHERSNSMKSSFVSISTGSERSIRVTPSHLLMSGDCDSDESTFRLQYASRVTLGACLLTSEGKDTVISTDTTSGSGIATLVTAESSGLLIVNGIVASSFASVHILPNALYSLHRILYSSLPSSWLKETLHSEAIRSLNQNIEGAFLSMAM